MCLLIFELSVHAMINTNAFIGVDYNNQLVNNELIIINEVSSFKSQIERCKNGNVLFVIKGNIDLNGDSVCLPTNSGLIFCSGCISNGRIMGKNWTINASPYVMIFHNVEISGMAPLEAYYSEWFGAQRNNQQIDCSKAINYCLSTFGSCKLHEGIYYIKKPIEMTSYNTLRGKGQGEHGTFVKKTSRTPSIGIKKTRQGINLNKDAIIIVKPLDNDPAGANLYNYVKINGLSLIGDSNYGILASDGRYLYLDDLFIYGCQYAIDVQFSWFVDIRNTQVNANYSKNPFHDSCGYLINDKAPYASYTAITIQNCYSQRYHVGYKICNSSYSYLQGCASDHSIRTAYYIHNCHGLSMISCGNECTILTDDPTSCAYYFSHAEVDINSAYTALLAKGTNSNNSILYKVDKSSSVTMRQCITDDYSKNRSVIVSESSELLIHGQKNLSDASLYKVSSNSNVINYFKDGLAKIINGIWEEQ